MNLPFKTHPLPWTSKWESGEFCHWDIKDANGNDVTHSRDDILLEILPLLNDEQKKQLGQNCLRLKLEDSFHEDWWRFKDQYGRKYTVENKNYEVVDEKSAKELIEGLVNV